VDHQRKLKGAVLEYFTYRIVIVDLIRDFKSKDLKIKSWHYFNEIIKVCILSVKT
jgi:hypothetical protein